MFKNFLSCAALAFAVSMAATAPMAQQTESEPQNEPDTATTGVESQLDLGQPVEDGPKLGERYSKQEFADWNLACIKTEAEQDPCSLLQIMKDDKGTPIGEFQLFRIKEGGQAVAGATVIVPLESFLPAQLTISVDGQPGKRYNYTFCNPIGCVAQIGLTQDDVNAFKKGAAATISLRPAPAPDQVVEMVMSLKGFTAGYEVVDIVANN